MPVQRINNTNFTVNLDYDLVVAKVNAANTITCTLPDLTNIDGTRVSIKFDPSSGALGTISVVPAGGQTIELQSSKSITFLVASVGQALKLYADSAVSNWVIESGLL
jgi:hypothetical protein